MGVFDKIPEKIVETPKKKEEQKLPIEYVMDCMGKNTTKVRNIRGYMMAAFFNAGSTIGSYYKAEMNHSN